MHFWRLTIPCRMVCSWWKAGHPITRWQPPNQKLKGSDLSRQSEVVEEVLALLDLAKKWDIEIPLEEVQTLMGQILDECVESVEKCWWGDGEEKPFHPNLVTLAEKLGFNVERFSKITGPNNSAT